MLYIIKIIPKGGRKIVLWVWHLLQERLPFVILALGLCVTGITTAYFSYTAEKQDRLLFQSEVTRARSEIENRVATYLALLRATRALFNSNPGLSREEFQAFVANLELRQRYPGLQGIGLAPRVPAEALAQFTENARAIGQYNFTVFPEGARNEYFPILYLEPQDVRNRAALGFDMFSEPVRQAAMSRAALEGTVAISGKVQLIQEIDSQKQAGLLIFLPVYALDTANTPQARQENLLGFVYIPLRAGDFFQSILGGVSLSHIQTQVYDGAAQPENALRQLPDNPAAQYSTTEKFLAGGREFTIECRTLPLFNAQSRRAWTPVLALSQLATTLLLFGIAYAETRARARAEEHARLLRRNAVERTYLLQSEQIARQAAEEANHAKDEFLALVSHELRTPLNSLAGWTRMLRNGVLDEAKRARALELIDRNIKVQVHLTEDLLDVSQLTAGHLKLDLQMVAVREITRAALAAAQPAAEDKGLKLSYELTDKEETVNADAARLQQILGNLLSNAIKFTPAGGSVHLTLERHAEHLEWTVSDNGQGIAPEFLPHIFQLFRQENNATTRYHGGLGLGLAIVRQLVKLHGGNIVAHSDGPGHGSRFILCLPLPSTTEK